MRVLLLGGTGAMGMSLAPLLAGRGDEVHVTSRSGRPDAGGVRYVRGDAHDPGFVRGLLEGARYDSVVDFMVYGEGEFQDRAGMMLSGTGQYVFLSSARVYAGGTVPITEESPRLLEACGDGAYLSTGEYALAKAREEDALRRSGRRNWTIVRPYITYNDNRLQLGAFEKEDWLYRALRGRAIVFQGQVAGRLTTLTHGRDVARVIAGLVGNPAALGETVQAASPEPARWDDILGVYLDAIEGATGRRPRVMYVPDWEPLAAVMGNRYQVEYDRLFDRAFDSRKADALAGCVAGDGAGYVPLRDGLRGCIESLVAADAAAGGLPQGTDAAQGSSAGAPASPWGRIAWHTQGYLDRLAGERTPMAEIPTMGGANEVPIVPIYATGSGNVL